jgi:hypothetical protein
VSSIALVCALVTALAASPDTVPAVAGKPLIRFVSIGAFKVTFEKTTPDRVKSILGPGKASQGARGMRIAYWSADEDHPVQVMLESQDGGHTITGCALSSAVVPSDSAFAAPRCRAKANEIVFDQGLSLGSSKQTWVAKLGTPQSQSHDAAQWARKRSWQQPATVGGSQMETWTEGYRVAATFQGQRLMFIDATKLTARH